MTCVSCCQGQGEILMELRVQSDATPNQSRGVCYIFCVEFLRLLYEYLLIVEFREFSYESTVSVPVIYRVTHYL